MYIYIVTYIYIVLTRGRRPPDAAHHAGFGYAIYAIMYLYLYLLPYLYLSITISLYVYYLACLYGGGGGGTPDAARRPGFG